jgi:hypothetical protein
MCAVIPKLVGTGLFRVTHIAIVQAPVVIILAYSTTRLPSCLQERPKYTQFMQLSIYVLMNIYI